MDKFAEIMARVDELGILESKQQTVRKLVQAAYWIGAMDGRECTERPAQAERRSEPRDEASPTYHTVP